MTDRIVRVVLRGDIVGLKAAFGEAVTVTQAAADKMTASTAGMTTEARKETEKYRSSLTTLGSQAGKIGLVAAAGFAVAVKSAADFNAEMALVKTLSHANASDMDKLSQAALTVGQNIGYSAKQVAQGEEEMIKAGVSVKDILGGGLKGALDLAAAGQTDVATATSIAASALTEFGLSGKDVPHVADELAAGADKALGSVEDLGLGLTQVGTTAHQMGLNLDQTVGTLAAFAQAGLIGERGGTTFKQMLLQLAAPTSQAQKLMERYGISLYNAAGQIKTMPELAGNLQDSLQNLTPAARNAALGVIFGSRAIQGANILMANGQKGIEDWISKTNDQGFAAQQASGKLDSLAGDFTKLKAAMQTAFIGAGSGSQGPLRDLTKGATNVLEAFNKLPDPMKAVSGDMLAITAIAGGGLWFGAKTIRGVADTREALKGLNVTLRDSEGNLTRTGTTFKRLTIGAGVLVGLAALDGAMSNIDHHDIGPTVNELTNALNGLASGKAKTIGKDFGDLGDAIHLVDSKSTGAVAGVENVLGPLTKLSEAISGGLGFSDRSVATKVDDATSRIQTLDQVLSGMVTSGSVAQARQAFDALAVSQGLSGDQQKRLLELLPGYRDALAGAAKTTGGVTDATGAMGSAVQQSTADLDAQAKALEENRKRALGIADSFDALGKSVNDAKVTLSGWLADMEKQTAAMRDFTKNAQTAAKRGLDEGLINALEKLGPEGALRLGQLASATKTELARANRDWRAHERVVDHMVDVIGGVPTEVGVGINVTGEDAAMAALARIDREIRNVPRQWRTDYYVVQHNAIAKRPQVADAQAHADGGTVTGQRYPYADKVMILAAPGEEVITNRHGEADRFRADRAAGRIPAYASGGTVPASALATRTTAIPAAGHSGLDYTRLGAAVAAAISGDRLVEFRDTRDAHLAALRTALREIPVQRAHVDPNLLYGVS